MNDRLFLVVIESPYAGDVEENVEYARKAMADSLARLEYPLASHLLYTQPGILNDQVPEEREQGMRAGLAWASCASRAVFYCDRGISPGMRAAAEYYRKSNMPMEVRWLDEPELEDPIVLEAAMLIGLVQR